VAATLVAAALVVPPTSSPAGAATTSCDAAVPTGTVVFVGTVDGQRRGYTRFEVTEVWAGPDLAPEVWVRTGEEEPPWPLSVLAGDVYESVDLAEGEPYVVGASRSFASSECRFREAGNAEPPADVRDPVADGDPGADPPLGPLGQALWTVGVGALVVGLVLWRRRRRAASINERGRPRRWGGPVPPPRRRGRGRPGCG
jgi:hypothetical protein